MTRLLHVTELTSDAQSWLEKAEKVHRELRPQLETHYIDQLRGIFEDGGEMVLAIDNDVVVGLALFRVYRDTFNGRKLYVDDLVTSSLERSKGIGHDIINWLTNEGKQRNVVNMVLDSGCQRTNAHRFYFREGFVISAFNFNTTISNVSKGS